jgi:hypothetical protein
MPAKKPHYVNNKLFLEAFKKYLPLVKPLRAKHTVLCKKLLKQGKSKEELPAFVRPQTPEYDYIGECLLKIATHLSYKPNFINYTFREDMIGDAIENSIQYLENFDPKKSNNPFAYFTQVMMFAFFRRITKEEKHAYIKQKSLESAIDFFSTQGGDDGEYANTYVKFMRDAKNDIIANFEQKKANKKKPGKKGKNRKKIDNPGIERFMVTSFTEPFA